MGPERGQGCLAEHEAPASALCLHLFRGLGLVIPCWASVSPPVQSHEEVDPNDTKDLLALLFDHCWLFTVGLP